MGSNIFFFCLGNTNQPIIVYVYLYSGKADGIQCTTTLASVVIMVIKMIRDFQPVLIPDYAILLPSLSFLNP